MILFTSHIALHVCVLHGVVVLAMESCLYFGFVCHFTFPSYAYILIRTDDDDARQNDD